jgi:hypothetical protein
MNWDEHPKQTTMGILLPKLLDIWPGTLGSTKAVPEAGFGMTRLVKS